MKGLSSKEMMSLFAALMAVLIVGFLFIMNSGTPLGSFFEDALMSSPPESDDYSNGEEGEGNGDGGSETTIEWNEAPPSSLALSSGEYVSVNLYDNDISGAVELSIQFFNFTSMAWENIDNKTCDMSGDSLACTLEVFLEPEALSYSCSVDADDAPEMRIVGNTTAKVDYTEIYDVEVNDPEIPSCAPP